MLRNVYLYGHIGDKYGKKHRFDVATPSEAARALSANFKSFYKDFKDGLYRVVVGDVNDGIELDATGTTFKLGSNDLHIIPIVSGSKSGRQNGGIIKAIIGVQLIVASFFIDPTGSTAALIAHKTLLTVGPILLSSGVATLLSNPARVTRYDNFEEPADRSSFVFNGATNKSKQGAPVPVVYGRMKTGSVIVSAGITTEQLL